MTVVKPLSSHQIKRTMECVNQGIRDAQSQITQMHRSICRALQAVLRDTGRRSSSRPLMHIYATDNVQDMRLHGTNSMWPHQVKEDYGIIFKACARTC